MSLYHTYRPSKFEQVIGNKLVLSSLSAEIAKDPDRRAHAFLFHGPTGCGKTTLARIAANEIGCVETDLREVDSADFRGIDSIREIRRQTSYRPMKGEARCWILDECHKLSNDAQNALLKALEDTPSHVYFMLCTTDPQKLIKPIRGRCAEYAVELLNEMQMKKLLRHVVKSEGEELEKFIYDQIILDAQGHARNALQILDQVLAVDEDKRLDVAKQTAEIESTTIELCRALIEGGSWMKVRGILNTLRGEEPESIRRAVLGYCASVLMNKENNLAGLIMEEMIEPFYDTGFPGLVFACYTIVNGRLEDDIPF